MKSGTQGTFRFHPTGPLGGDPLPTSRPLPRGSERPRPLIGGEDEIFRDPFGDFAPSGR